MNGPAITWKTDEGRKNFNLSISADSTTIASGAPVEDCSGSTGTLFMYLDESGNFDFGEKGTRYFMMTCLLTRRPFPACHELLDARYDLIEGNDEEMHEKFHACEDKPAIKSMVYRIISKHIDEYDAYVFVVDKTTVKDEMKNAAELYAKTFEWIVSKVYEEAHLEKCDKIVVITDALPKEATQKNVAKPLKSCMKRVFQNNGIPYSLMHHPSESDFNLQIADYLCWAAKRNQCDGKDWPYSLVQGAFTSFGYLDEK